jgi:hypothetical protein
MNFALEFMALSSRMVSRRCSASGQSTYFLTSGISATVKARSLA